MGALPVLRGHAFHLNQSLLWTQKASICVPRSTNDQATLSYSFLFVLHLFISQTHWKWWSRKRKRGWSTQFLSLLTLSYFSKPKGEISGGCAQMKKWTKRSWINFVGFFYCCGNKNIHKNVWAAKYTSCNSGDSGFKLNAFSYLHFKLAFHNI